MAVCGSICRVHRVSPCTSAAEQGKTLFLVVLADNRGVGGVFNKTVFADDGGENGRNLGRGKQCVGRLGGAYWIYSELVVWKQLSPKPMVCRSAFVIPILFDFTSAILVRLGLSVPWSLQLPGIIFGLVIVILLFKLTEKITMKPLAGAVAVIIFMFSGGLGWIYLIPGQKYFACL